MTKKGPLDFPLHRGSESDSPTRETNLTKEVLEASRAQLEATDIRVAVFVAEFDAGLVVTRERLIQGEEQAREVWEAGGLVFTADEMLSMSS